MGYVCVPVKTGRWEYESLNSRMEKTSLTARGGGRFGDYEEEWA